MADITASEVTELARTSLNQAQGKKFQILELHIVHTFVNGDALPLSAVPNCHSIVSVLGLQMMAGAGWFAPDGAEWYAQLSTRPDLLGASGLPTSPADDAIEFPSGGTDLIDQILVQLLIVSD